MFPLLGLRRRRGGYNKLSRDPQQTTAAEEEANHIEVLQQDSRGTNVFCLFDVTFHLMFLFQEVQAFKKTFTFLMDIFGLYIKHHC